jgi:L-asparaginase
MKDTKPSILLIYTGGTIGMVKDYDSGALKAFDFSNLEKQIPELKQIDCQISSLSFDYPIDSSNITPDHWIALVELIEKNYSLLRWFCGITRLRYHELYCFGNQLYD